MNESEETEEVKTFSHNPYQLFFFFFFRKHYSVRETPLKVSTLLLTYNKGGQVLESMYSYFLHCKADKTYDCGFTYKNNLYLENISEDTQEIPQ